ncbi:WbqC family protein [Kitasatospora sp. NPDC051853]|uniref:WbqC family protein n=1 Tax=Kitasatospora sp. NPDC051853 TaxID=3364058 RepID=UPI0037B2ED24
MPTSGSSPKGSPADFSPDTAPGGLVCAIHQPNLLPRLSTLAKLFAADVWVVLDDVQFARRDYQHRARLGSLSAGGSPRWLTLPTHLPQGRATLIRNARVVDGPIARRRIEGILREEYRSSTGWPVLAKLLQPVLDLVERTDRTAEVTEASTLVLLDLMGWPGRVVRSSDLAAGPGRTRRLVDLCRAVGATSYLCGTGGARYVEPELFGRAGIELRQFSVPTTGVWAGGRTFSTVNSLLVHGSAEVRRGVNERRQADLLTRNGKVRRSLIRA